MVNLSDVQGIDIITVAKVASATFLYSLSDKWSVTHDHNLALLRNILATQENRLIIVGIRNPIDRNLSYFFQCFHDPDYNTLCTRKNGYKGEILYEPSIHPESDPKEVIQLYFQHTFHTTFNDWFEEFFEITKINESTFHKQQGFDFYSLPNKNTIMVYTLEKLHENEDFFCTFFGIPRFILKNIREETPYAQLYKDVKRNIVYSSDYIDKLLDTAIMKFFYSDQDIQHMYSQYKYTKN